MSIGIWRIFRLTRAILSSLRGRWNSGSKPGRWISWPAERPPRAAHSLFASLGERCLLCRLSQNLAREANSDRGWLRVGPPSEHRISGASGWQTRMVAPEPGTLVLMPGYFFHDTSPMGVDQERICIAFDVTPREFCPPAGPDDY